MFDRHGVPKARLEVLRKVPMFEGLSKKVLERIDSHCDEIEIPSGRTIVREGDVSQEAFIVAAGEAEIRIGDDVVRQTEVGEMIGELGVLTNRPRAATVKAVTDMRVLVINGRDLDWLFKDKRLAARVQENLDRHQPDPQQS